MEIYKKEILEACQIWDDFIGFDNIELSLEQISEKIVSNLKEKKLLSVKLIDMWNKNLTISTIKSLDSSQSQINNAIICGKTELFYKKNITKMSPQLLESFEKKIKGLTEKITQ